MALPAQRAFVTPNPGEDWNALASRVLPDEPGEAAIEKLKSWNLHLFARMPPGSFLGDYFRQHECGLVVEQADPAALAAALGRLIDDPGLRARLTANAAARLRADFDRERAQARFIEALK